METFIQFAQDFGSYTFKVFMTQTAAPVQGTHFETKMFHLTKEGVLKKLVYQGKYWQQGTSELVEDVALSAEDFEGKEEVLAALEAELQAKRLEYEMAKTLPQEAQEFPI